MRRISFVSLVLIPVAVSLAAARPRPNAAAAEVARLHAHFDSVGAELRAADLSRLGAAQRAARERHVATLRAYRDRGRFPQNTDFPGRRVAYFVDGEGTACAVGYLLLADGRSDIVRRVRSANNHVLVPALAGDTAFRAWLDGAGLTLAEAARIQPTYGFDGQQGVDTPTAVLSGVVGALGGVSVGVNLAARPSAPGRRWRVGAGVAAGAVNLLLASTMANIGDDPGARTLAAVNAVVGVGSLASAAWAGLRGTPAPPRANGDSGAESANRRPEFSLAPGAVPSAGGRTQVGLVGRVRF